MSIRGPQVIDLEPADDAPIPLTEADIAEAMQLEPIRRITRDLKASAHSLTRHQARYIVNLYYQVQGFRLRAGAQTRAAEQADTPNAFVSWTMDSMRRVEDTIKLALDSYSDFHPLGQWAKSVPGIGPVICAGFLAILDEAPPPTVGHWYRFAGLDPSLEWLGSERASKLVTEVMGTGRQVTIEHLAEIAARTKRPLDTIQRFALGKNNQGQAVDVRAVMNETVSHLATGDINAALDAMNEHGINLFSVAGLDWDNSVLDEERMPTLVTNIGDAALAIRTALRELEPEEGSLGTRAALVAGLSRRPWSAALKVLCWKAGESFVKVSNKPTDVYGHLYAERKAAEAVKNANGEYAEQAEIWMKRVGRDTQAYGWYEKGQLPPGHLHSRAKRFAVKIFLSHYHTVAYWLRYNSLPVKPYPVEHLGHAHIIPVPFTETVPGLTEALRDKWGCAV